MTYDWFSNVGRDRPKLQHHQAIAPFICSSRTSLPLLHNLLRSQNALVWFSVQFAVCLISLCSILLCPTLFCLISLCLISPRLASPRLVLLYPVSLCLAILCPTSACLVPRTLYRNLLLTVPHTALLVNLDQPKPQFYLLPFQSEAQ